MKSLRKLIQKKGVYDILLTLSIIPKRYNQIKEDVLCSISSRTLDARLSECVTLNLIQLKNRLNDIREYSLTNSGGTLLSILRALSSESTTLNTELFIDKMMNLERQLNLNWENIWPQIIEILEKKGEILTLSSNPKINIISSIDERGIMVQTEKDVSLVPIELIRQAWNYLVEDGVLYLKEHEKSTYRSSFICAMFNELD